jgi:hypothetical protein
MRRIDGVGMVVRVALHLHVSRQTLGYKCHRDSFLSKNSQLLAGE